ncbi:MAG TPA: hypothetical protein ENG98_03280 [Actinobacteria bacterium]|nr:hypothetical protein [Actinomycetota bacterium]
MKKLALAVLTGALIVGMVNPAGASVSGPCDGSATIQGTTYTPANDTPSNPIVLPNRNGVTIPYQGNVGFSNKDFNGKIGVTIAGVNVKIDDWTGVNDDDIREKVGEYELDDFYDQVDSTVPGGRVPGLWRLWVEHSADGGSCSAFALIKIEGNPLSTPAGALTLILTLIAAGLLTRSLWVKVKGGMVKQRIVLGVIAGLILGLGIGLLMFMYGLRTLDRTVLIYLPLFLAAVGLALARWGPMGRPLNS